MIYGIDCSMRRIAICSVIDKFLDGLKLPPTIQHTACIALLSAWTKTIIPTGASVFIEAPVIAGAMNIQSTLKAAMTVGGVIGALPHATIHLVPVSSWKKDVCGHGGADKFAVAEWLAASSPALSKACNGDQDLIDATCIALYGHLGALS